MRVAFSVLDKLNRQQRPLSSSYFKYRAAAAAIRVVASFYLTLWVVRRRFHPPSHPNSLKNAKVRSLA